MTVGTKDELNSTFYLAFIGQQVTITVNVLHTINFETAEGSNVETMPMFYDGILLDTDEEYYYLGNNPQEINQAIKKSSVVHIMVIENKTLFDQILEEMPNPSNSEDVN